RALPAAIQPALGRRSAFAVRRRRLATEKPRAPIRVAVPDVDHATIIELSLFGTIHFGDVVMPVTADQAKIVASVEPAPVMFGEALADVTRVRDIALAPEFDEPRGRA